MHDLEAEGFDLAQLGALLREAETSKHDVPFESLCELFTSPSLFGVTTASVLQRYICYLIEGKLPPSIYTGHDHVVSALGVKAVRPWSPQTLVVLSGIRGGKSLLVAAAAVHATQTVDLSALGPGEIPRFSIVSLTVDLAKVLHSHIVGRMLASPKLSALLVQEPTADSIYIRSPSGRTVEIKIVAGSRAGASLVARWSIGVAFDEAPRMTGSGDSVVNLDDLRNAIQGRLLPGAREFIIGSPWAPSGPVYNLWKEHWGKPSDEVVVLRARADWMHPKYWTQQRSEQLRRKDERAYRTDYLAEWADKEESLYPLSIRESATDITERVYNPACSYVAAIDPATRADVWSMVVLEQTTQHQRRVMAVHEWQGTSSSPLNPDDVLKDIASILKHWRLSYAWTDQASGDALRALATRHGVQLHIHTWTASSKGMAFGDLAKMIANRTLLLNQDLNLHADLSHVLRRTTQTGSQIVLPRVGGRHCDIAVSLALASKSNMSPPRVDPRPVGMSRDEWETLEAIRLELEGRRIETADWYGVQHELSGL